MRNPLMTSSCCPLCDGDLTNHQFSARDFLTKVPGVFNYRRCSVCGSYIQSPLPTQKFLDSCYESQGLGYFQPPEIDAFNNLPNSTIKSILKDLMIRIFPRLRIINLLPVQFAPAKILEIGCSYGYGLYNYKKMGYDVTGIELNKDMVLYAKQKLHLDVREGHVETCSFDEGGFDIIILSMVLEHCLNPRKVIEKLSSWLRPGGEMLVSLPCCEGFEFKKFRENCYIVHAPYHIFLPSIKGIYSLISPYFQIDDIAFQFFHRDLTASAAFAYQHQPNLFNHLLSKLGNIKKVHLFIRCVLFLLICFGLKTSRISLRCSI